MILTSTVFSRPYFVYARAYATVFLHLLSVSLWGYFLCVVAKWCVLEQKLLLRAYRKSYNYEKSRSLYYNLPKSQINRLQLIQNCLARTVVKAPKSSLVTPILRSLHWLKINERTDTDSQSQYQ